MSTGKKFIFHSYLHVGFGLSGTKPKAAQGLCSYSNLLIGNNLSEQFTNYLQRKGVV